MPKLGRSGVRTLLPLLLFIFSLSTQSVRTTAITRTNSNLHFKEAPQIYNSPNCSSINSSVNAVHDSLSLAAILSVLQHSSCPENIIFHFVASSSAESTHLNLTLHFTIYPIQDIAAVEGLFDLNSLCFRLPLNYAGNYLADLLPQHLQKVVYLDSDLVLVNDIAELAATPLTGNSVLAAPEYCNANFNTYFTPTFWSNPSLSLTFANRNRKPGYFNTGVMVIDLERWRAGDYTTKVVEWMELQERMRIYELGSLPPFLLVFAGNIAPVDHSWNQHGLGGDNFRGICRERTLVRLVSCIGAERGSLGLDSMRTALVR